jgi:hypothetical protein
LWIFVGKTTLCKVVVRSIKLKSVINKKILNPYKNFMLTKIDGGQQLIQGTAQHTRNQQGTWLE